MIPAGSADRSERNIVNGKDLQAVASEGAGSRLGGRGHRRSPFEARTAGVCSSARPSGNIVGSQKRSHRGPFHRAKTARGNDVAAYSLDATACSLSIAKNYSHREKRDIILPLSDFLGPSVFDSGMFRKALCLVRFLLQCLILLDVHRA
jgi:hypothetical protein